MCGAMRNENEKESNYYLLHNLEKQKHTRIIHGFISCMKYFVERKMINISSHGGAFSSSRFKQTDDQCSTPKYGQLLGVLIKNDEKVYLQFTNSNDPTY